MTKLTFEMDTPVLYKNKLYLVKSPINLTQLLLVDVESGDVLAANICDLKTNSLTPSISSSEQSKFLTISNLEWDEAKRREAILEPLSKLSMCPVAMANEAAHKLNLSVRQIYTLINRYRNSDFQLLSLLPYQPTGGKNKGRIATELEEIIQKVIKECYLTKQKLKVSVIVEEIRRQCYHKNIKPPAAGTIRARVNTIKSEEKVRLRESTQQSKYQYHSFEGTFPTPDHPLDVIQIDHTPVDIIIVDDFHRKPIGRPYLTIAIDVYSRCIAGFILTLEAPSSVSVGLCLTHAILDKQEGLLKQNLEHSNWPIWGKPNTLYVDNAKEFHSKALERGCEVHGIKINYRPIGEPHYGGIVERVIGTFMQLTHQLPGTTFSNIFEKGDYPSEKKAVLTLSELERWFTIAITQYYHEKQHKGLDMSPLEKYKLGILGDAQHKGRGYPPRIENKEAFLIDFLPIERRTLQKHGFTLDKIDYFHTTLKPLIMERKKLGKFIIRRDPRNLSKIYVLDPTTNNYHVVPYRTINRPSITLWEHRLAIKNLREKSHSTIDENALFKAIEDMREIVNEAALTTKSARRTKSRTVNALKNEQSINNSANTNNQSNEEDKEIAIELFEDIETW